MAQQSGIVKGDLLQRIGSIGFIFGAIVLLVGNGLFPRVADPSNIQAMLQKWADQKVLLQIAGLLVAFGIWGITIGVVGVYRSISAGSGAPLARLGFYGVLVGAALWPVNIALAAATGSMAAAWAAAPVAGKAAALSAASAIQAANEAVYSMGIIELWLALVFVGIGMAISKLYPGWMGWVLVALGAITMVAVGFIQFFAGMGSALQTLFAILAGLTTIWVLVIGIWVARKAW